MGKQTSLYNQHLLHHARIVDFAGYDMPLHYGSQINEHMAVRKTAGIFDVSHMHIVEITGLQAKLFLSYLLANNIHKINPGQALYSCLLNPEGGVKDDLIVYMYSDSHYRLILNAGTKEKDLYWLKKNASEFDHIQILPRHNLSIIALQGPKAFDCLKKVFEDKPNLLNKLRALKSFCFIQDNNLFIARTGYTGEDGVEILVENSQAEKLWKDFIHCGAVPAGLGARDTLRLEAGLNLYGQDMDETTSPLESNLSWTIAYDPAERNFIGKQALLAKNISQQLAGIILEQGGILRHDQKIMTAENKEIGVITSGGFSPLLNYSIGLARISLDIKHTEIYYVNIRNKLLPIKIMPPAFVKKGKVLNYSKFISAKL